MLLELCGVLCRYGGKARKEQLWSHSKVHIGRSVEGKGRRKKDAIVMYGSVDACLAEVALP